MAKEMERRTQAERRATSHARLLESAAEVLVEEGFAAATFDRISRRAGYSRGMLTERFGSKDEMVADVIQWVAGQMDDHYASELENDDSTLSGLRAKINTTLWGVRDGPGRAYFVLLAAVLANRLPQMAHFREHHRREKAEYISLVTHAQKMGMIDPEIDPVHLSALFGCLMIGIAIQAQIEPDADLDALQKALNAVIGHLAANAERAGERPDRG